MKEWIVHRIRIFKTENGNRIETEIQMLQKTLLIGVNINQKLTLSQFW